MKRHVSPEKRAKWNEFRPLPPELQQFKDYLQARAASQPNPNTGKSK